MKIYYNPNLKQLSRDLRNNSTLSEVLLWKQLKERKMVTVHSIKNRIFSVILCFCVFVAKVFMPLKH